MAGIFRILNGTNSFKPAHDAAYALIEFEDEGQGLIHVTTMSHKPDRVIDISAEFDGEAGSLEVNFTVYNDGGVGVIRGARQGEKEFKTIEIPESYYENIREKTVVLKVIS